MPKCIAITKAGAQCKIEGGLFENHCKRHFDMKRTADPAFRARYEAHVAAAAEAERVAVAERARRVEEEAARRRAAAEARLAAEQAARRAEKVAKRDRHLVDVANLGPVKIIDHARKVIDIWNTNNVHGYNIPRAYVALCYRPQSHAGYTALITAVIRLRFQAFGNHPDHTNYRDVPVAEREEVLTALHAALVPYGEIDVLRALSETDGVRTVVLARVRADEEAARRAAALEAERLRQAAFQQRLREVPVVFQRDPEGGIDLRAFAADTQSVHRSSVQNSTHKTVVALLARPKLEGVDVLEEIIVAFNDSARVHWWGAGTTEAARTAAANAARDASVTELTNDYFNTEAFSVRYGDVVDRVWAFIRGHEHHNDMCTRLAQEICEGRGMCSNGKMARLVNVLMGYDDALMTEAPREVFQFRMAALRKAPREEREATARELFREFSIPEAEHDAWLEPLMEPEDDSPVRGGAAGAAATT